MNILIALTYFLPHYSGMTVYAERQARALARRGHRVTVLTSRFNQGLPPREWIDGVEVIRPRVRMRLSKGVIMPSMPYWAWKLLRQADAVNLHLPQMDASYMALMGRLLGKPVVVTYQCDLVLPRGLVNSIANQGSHLANRISAGAANAIVTITRDYAEHSTFLKRYLSKVHPILAPIDLPPVSEADRAAFRGKAGLQPGQRVIGMNARLATEKGVEYLAQAIPQVLQAHPQARVLFVGQHQNVFGEEGYARRLAPLIEQLGEHWTFLGILPSVEHAAFFHECEITALPSLNSTEAFGLVQVESMACGTPVVASDLPGVRVPVQMTGMGRVVPPGDAEALAQALIEVLDHPQDYRRDASRLLDQTTLEHVAREYEALFETLRSGRRLG
jgi:glycosyltransferase involved in cell wall biosynthesis